MNFEMQQNIKFWQNRQMFNIVRKNHEEDRRSQVEDGDGFA